MKILHSLYPNIRSQPHHTNSEHTSALCYYASSLLLLLFLVDLLLRMVRRQFVSLGLLLLLLFQPLLLLARLQLGHHSLLLVDLCACARVRQWHMKRWVETKKKQVEWKGGERQKKGR